MEHTEPGTGGVSIKLGRLSGPLFATKVNLITKDALLTATDVLMQKTERPIVILGHNLHSAYLYRTNNSLRALYDCADIIIADGKPIAVDTNLALALQGSKDRVERIGSTDWILELVQRNLPRHLAVVGTSNKANRQFVSKMKSLSPLSTVIGIPGENWNEAKAESTVRTLRDFGPSIVFVGLGMPLQEEFLYQAIDDLPPALYIAVGGALDQLTGNQTLAPRWLGKFGFEWLWRLVHHPKKLAFRYLVEPVLLTSKRAAEIFHNQPLSICKNHRSDRKCP